MQIRVSTSAQSINAREENKAHSIACCRIIFSCLEDQAHASYWIMDKLVIISEIHECMRCDRGRVNALYIL